MDQKFLYLTLNISSFIVPFAFSFYPKASFAKVWRYYLPAITITAILFIVWDEWFTQSGVWGFNRNYVSGIFIGELPLEEILFFFCIPYACIFTYFAFNHLIEKDWLNNVEPFLTAVLVVSCLLFGVIFFDRLYTSVTMFSLAILLALVKWVLKAQYLSRFYFSYAVILIPFFIVNGILTGSWIEEPVVWYNNAENIGFRIGTIPIEDMFYAMLMLLLSICIGSLLMGRKKNSPVRGY